MSTPPAAPLNAAPRRHAQPPEHTAYEMLETLLVALVWVLVLRYACMEFFRIPTGSMAPTLLGVHRRVACPRCGMEFTVGAPTYRNTGEYNPEDDTHGARCPNCLRVFETEAWKPRPGNRILVNKFIYDFREPERWEIIVFRNPENPLECYIKRCVAKSGETLDIRHGDIYVNGTIARKPDAVQEAVWLPVYDSALAVDPGEWSPWRARQWRLERNRFVSTGGGATCTLEYRDDILDRYGYEDPEARGEGRGGETTVGDFLLEFEFQAQGDTVLECKVGEDVDVFQCAMEIRDGRADVVLRRGQGEDGEFTVIQAPGGIALAPGWNRLAFTNVDDAVRLWINGEAVGTVWEYESSPESDDYGDNVVAIAAAGAEVELRDLRVRRDVHYTGGVNGALAREIRDLNREGGKFYVGFGDHTTNSRDSREFGVVPADHLLGRAVFVVWPVDTHAPFWGWKRIR